MMPLDSRMSLNETNVYSGCSSGMAVYDSHVLDIAPADMFNRELRSKANFIGFRALPHIKMNVSFNNIISTQLMLMEGSRFEPIQK